MGSAGDEVDFAVSVHLNGRKFLSGFEELDVGDEDGVIDLLKRNIGDQKIVLGEVIIQIVIDSFHFFLPPLVVRRLVTMLQNGYEFFHIINYMWRFVNYDFKLTR